MSKIQVRHLLIAAVLHFFLDPHVGLAGGKGTQDREPWDPISLAGSSGNRAVGLVVQLPADICHETDSQGEPLLEPDVVKVRACKGQANGTTKLLALPGSEAAKVCSKNPYFPMGRRCEECRRAETSEGPKNECLAVKDDKNPNALEFEVGNVEFDDRPILGGKDDITYATVGYRRYWLQAGRRDWFRLFFSGGLGVYDVEPTQQLGLNARVGAEVGLHPKKDRKLYWTAEFAFVYHWLENGLKTHDVLFGVRLHFPH